MRLSPRWGAVLHSNEDDWVVERENGVDDEGFLQIEVARDASGKIRAFGEWADAQLLANELNAREDGK